LICKLSSANQESEMASLDGENAEVNGTA
jgi:hypothetical protein